ncbi:Carrier domain-containing protein OS=Streptomyces fumanus OX=67302 GN=GCM10018772_59690 PE=4 SV=1 [Streptomyces fumanus]
MRRSFDLAVELPWRVSLLVLSPVESVLVIVAHHIAVDGWSMGILARDLETAYAARVRGGVPGWEPLPVQYADYALWQREVLGDVDDPDSVISEQLDHWRTALADLPDELSLPTDRPRPARASYRGGFVPVRVDAGTHRRLTQLANQQGVTMFMVTQAAVAVLLSKLGAGTDIPLGTVLAGRDDAALEDLAGFFVNTLVLRTDLSGNPTLTELLARVRDTDLAAYAHQDMPFERLVDELNPARSLARHPLFQVMLTFQNIPQKAATLDLPGLRTSPLARTAGSDGTDGTEGTDGTDGTDTEAGAAKFDLSFTLAEQRDADGAPAGIVGSIQYATDLFDLATAQRLAVRLGRVLEWMAGDPGVRVGEVEVLSEGERRLVVEEWNDSGRVVSGGTLPELFEAQVVRTPGAVAVEFGGVGWTYGELEERANQFAWELMARGVGPGDRVPLSPAGASAAVVPIGRPMDNTRTTYWMSFCVRWCRVWWVSCMWRVVVWRGGMRVVRG